MVNMFTLLLTSNRVQVYMFGAFHFKRSTKRAKAARTVSLYNFHNLTALFALVLVIFAIVSHLFYKFRMLPYSHNKFFLAYHMW